MIFCSFIFWILSWATAFDPDLWIPYNETTVADMSHQNPYIFFKPFNVTYTLEPFVIYIEGDDNASLASEDIQKIFSVYYNYTDYHYIERVRAVVVSTKDDLSNVKLRSDVSLPDNSQAPAYFIHNTGSCRPHGIHSTSDCYNVGAAFNKDDDKQCVVSDGNYVLYSESNTAVTGYIFSPECGHGNFLAVYLAPDMFVVGTLGKCCHYESWKDCKTGKYLTETCERDKSAYTGYVTPYNSVFSFAGNEDIAKDGTYNSMGYCEKTSSGECFVPDWY